MQNFGQEPKKQYNPNYYGINFQKGYGNNYNNSSYEYGYPMINQNNNNSDIYGNNINESLLSHDQPAKVSDLYGSARKAFIKKVYIILSCQLLFTVFLTSLSMLNQAFFQFQVNHIALFYIAFVLALVIQIYVFCCSGGRNYPGNLITTSLFTLCEGYIVSFIASITGKTSGNSIVFLAALMTLTITIACTLYAIFTDEDFTTCGALIAVVAALMLVLFVILLFTDSPFLHILYCALGVFLVSVYLIIDTQMIVGGRSVELTVDEYYFGALLLYVDIITLFLYLLELFREINSSE